jgi:uncharacterized protein
MTEAAMDSPESANAVAPPYSGSRIVTLDVVRGVAVMGILAMNIVGFALPREAYMNPMSFGWNAPTDAVSWAISFIFIDGKMRGLFSFLFGASMLLIITKADEAGEDPASLHFKRMLWLLLFGLIHLYFIWWGDILAHYALVGMIAWFFHMMSVRSLVGMGIFFVFIQFAVSTMIAISAHQASIAATAPGASAQALAAWRSFSDDFVIRSPQELAQTLSLYRGGWTGIAMYQLKHALFDPIVFLPLIGWETLAYMLLGMASLRSGFLTGHWTNRAYFRVVAVGFGAGIPLYALMAGLLLDAHFAVPAIFTYTFAASTLVRPLMIMATAALVILLARRSGPVVARISAAGRTAFTNYLGTSMFMVLLFYGYGFGLFGQLDRAELWLVVIPMWGLMLLWSKPWLDRFRYGPFEWLWRSLARGSVQPLRREQPILRSP